MGWEPRYQDLDWTGLDFPQATFEELQRVDAKAWRQEVLGQEELFLDLHSHLPKELLFERELLICRVVAAEEAGRERVSADGEWAAC